MKKQPTAAELREQRKVINRRRYQRRYKRIARLRNSARPNDVERGGIGRRSSALVLPPDQL